MLVLVALFVLAIAGPAEAATQSVSIGDNFYSPSTVTITVEDTVAWTNNGQNEHSVTADDGSFDSSPNCPNSGCLTNGDTYSHTFNSVGSFTYYCRVHGHAMSGKVVVEAATTTPPPSGGGHSGGGSGSSGGAGGTITTPLPHTGPEPFATAFPAFGLLALVSAGGLLLFLRRRRA